MLFNTSSKFEQFRQELSSLKERFQRKDAIDREDYKVLQKQLQGQRQLIELLLKELDMRVERMPTVDSFLYLEKGYKPADITPVKTAEQKQTEALQQAYAQRRNFMQQVAGIGGLYVD